MFLFLQEPKLNSRYVSYQAIFNIFVKIKYTLLIQLPFFTVGIGREDDSLAKSASTLQLLITKLVNETMFDLLISLAKFVYYSS